jgi:hypothetical protein
MSSYKGRQNAKAIELDFPHFVDIVVPLGGFGAKLDAMYDFHTRRGDRSAVMGGMMPMAVFFAGALLILLYLNDLRMCLPRAIRFRHRRILARQE